MTTTNKPTTLCAFIRITPAGSFEKVTWTRNTDGTKEATKEPVQPTREHALKIAQSPYQETKF